MALGIAGEGSQAEFKAEFAKIDSDSSGEISFDEFCTWSAERKYDFAEDAADELQDETQELPAGWLASRSRSTGEVRLPHCW